MAPQVQRAKSAFQFYQTDCIAKIKNELGPDATMGLAMTELSSRWKTLSEDLRAPYVAQEEQDRQRYYEESTAADAIAAEEQRKKRDLLTLQDGESSSHRGARMKMKLKSEEDRERKRRRQEKIEANIDPEEVKKRERAKEKKKKETRERQRLRDEQEKAVKERHRKLDKTASTNASKRLDYLLSRSSIFAQLKSGKGSGNEDENVDTKKSSNSHRERKKTQAIEQEESDEEEDNHVFLTKQPSCIKFGTLKPYQLEGLNWMIHLAEKGLNGILADEMGLGKTLQSISILAYHYEYNNLQGPHLVCVPKSTLSNWMNEINRWCPSLRAIRFHGSREERAELAEKYFTHKAAAHDGKRPSEQIKNEETGEMEDDNSENPRKWDICVTTYEVCNSEKKVLSKFAWKYLVIDEAHRLKNEASVFSKNIREFKTSHRLLLTGTPLQNNLHELWALLNFLLPDIFSSADQFDEWFDLEIDDEDAKKNMISQLHKILSPFMIRRLKSDVAKGLPPKTETLLMVGMSKIQKQLYKKLLLRDIESLTGSSTGKQNKTAILNIVMQLRKCCAHPYLFEGVEDRSLDPLGEHLVDNCGKLVLVDKLLKKLKERGSRVLIFTQMTRVLDILEDFMRMRDYQYCRIDGNTAHEDRESSIADYNKPDSEKFCFILSTRAGGLGINLQTADTCILYDSDWNPQADLQAQDRCHRLGQKKPVNVYRLVTENTVEEKIVERAQQKLKLDAMVVQQGRLKEKDKVSKEEMMAAVRFGADAVFRSEESTITDDDIDAILERGKAKMKELSDKIQAKDKGDLLDFRLDAGISAQNFEGIDYSDRELRDQLRLLAADSIGKRERKPPPIDYNPIITPKKTMIVNNRKIKLPKSLRLPRMEDHQFFNRERLLELGKLEFETYASLRQLGKCPPREEIDRARTLLPPELAQEKLELLSEGFAFFTRSQYFQFVKACVKFGRDDFVSISNEMDLPLDLITNYSASFWKYGPAELKEDEWERARTNIEKGEQKIKKKRKNQALLGKFIGSFKDPRNEIVFANKGTVHFALEQDRAILTSVDKIGYGNWDGVKESLRQDISLRFQHAVQGMNVDKITKRCDYRMRQMEKELEEREKQLKKEKSANVIAAFKSLEAIEEIEKWENDTARSQIVGKEPKPLKHLAQEAKENLEERLNERQALIDRVREIEIQVRECKELAAETRKGILRGDQYVNYSNITLKAGGPNGDDDNNIYKEISREEQIGPRILQVPPCAECKNCIDPRCSRNLCLKRLAERQKLMKDETINLSISAIARRDSAMAKKLKRGPINGKISSTGGKMHGITPKIPKKKGPVPGKKRGPRPNTDHNRGNPLGNKRMAVPDDKLPELCKRISPQGTNKRMQVIEEFAKETPSASIRQVTFKFGELVTKDCPPCITPVKREKRSGRAFTFYLRPRFYHMVPEEMRPENWEKYAKEDEELFKQECAAKARDEVQKDQRMKDIMGEDATSHVSENEASNMTMDESESEQPKKKKLKK